MTCCRLFACFGLLVFVVPLQAQEMRIYTTIRNLAAVSSSDHSEPAPIISRSLTLFHAGKVYDYVVAAKEVTVFEPAHHRFTLLNERRHTVTEVTNDEVRHYLGLVEEEGWKRLEATDEARSIAQLRALAWLKLQLKPDFKVGFDTEKNTVTMVETDFRYQAEGHAPPSQGVVESYLRFADAAAELNSVLHPHVPLPRPRLRLNEELRQRELLPVVVDLQANMDHSIHLQARHEWTWKFLSTDRQLISSWDSQLADTTQRRVSFRQYQQESLAAEVSKSR